MCSQTLPVLSQVLLKAPAVMEVHSECYNISKMYFRHWKPPGVSERMWSVNLDASISGEYQTLEGHSCRPSEELGALATSLGVPTTSLGGPGNPGNKSGSTLNCSREVWEKQYVHWERCRCAWKS
jgi:hypothetical protein